MAIEMRCCDCGSDTVTRDAWAAWDVERQAWVLANVFDDGFCQHCEREVSLEERTVLRLVESGR